MIGIIFQFGGEVIEIRISGYNILFKSSTYGSQYASIDNLYLSKEGVIKEYPDLKDNDLWREEAIKRFKDEIKKLANEKKIADYIIKDLSKHGYIPKYKQESGKRVEVLDDS
jgi:DNA-binding MarR family transcriptional regulator